MMFAPITELSVNRGLHINGGQEIQIQPEPSDVVGRFGLKRTLLGKVAEAFHDITAQTHEGHLIAIGQQLAAIGGHIEQNKVLQRTLPGQDDFHEELMFGNRLLEHKFHMPSATFGTFTYAATKLLKNP